LSALSGPDSRGGKAMDESFVMLPAPVMALHTQECGFGIGAVPVRLLLVLCLCVCCWRWACNEPDGAWLY